LETLISTFHTGSLGVEPWYWFLWREDCITDRSRSDWRSAETQSSYP